MKIISEQIVYPHMYVELACGMYFTRVNTEKEFKYICATKLKNVPTIYKLSDSDKIPNDACCVLMEFSSEKDYTQTYLRFVRVPRIWFSKFNKGLQQGLV